MPGGWPLESGLVGINLKEEHGSILVWAHHSQKGCLVYCGLGDSQSWESLQSNLWLLKFTIGAWKVTSVMGKEPELLK